MQEVNKTGLSGFLSKTCSVLRFCRARFPDLVNDDTRRRQSSDTTTSQALTRCRHLSLPQSLQKAHVSGGTDARAKRTRTASAFRVYREL